MNKLSFFIALLLLIGSTLFAQVGINSDNSNPHPSAGLDVKFNNKGLLPPRISKVELNAIADPADGLLVYCTDCGSNGLGSLSMYMAGAWYSLGPICMNPISPSEGINIPGPTQITWNWNTVPNATGYKWSTANIYAGATDMGTATTKTETGLICGTPYTRYVWAYNGCGYSLVTALNQITGSCVVVPTVTTTAMSSIALTTATSGGNVTWDGGGTVTERGVCYRTSPNPTISGSKTTDGGGPGVFTSYLSALLPNTLYYVKAYATNSVGTGYGDQVSFTTLSFAIGQAYGGGIIFYLDGTGQHGLISATSDQSFGDEWGCYGTSIPGTSTAIGTGQANTTLIVNGCSEAGRPARICNDLVLGGYDDWFLPSKDELYLMYAQRAAIGGFVSNYYWSSSEYNASSAWAQYFYYGTQTNLNKNGPGYVRAVRAF